MKHSFGLAGALAAALAFNLPSAVAQAPAASSSAPASPPPNPNAELVQKLKTAPNNVARLDLLQSSDYIL